MVWRCGENKPSVWHWNWGTLMKFKKKTWNYSRFQIFSQKSFKHAGEVCIRTRFRASHFRSENSVWFYPAGNQAKEKPGCRVFTVASVLHPWWNLRLDLRTSVWWDTRPVFTFTALVPVALCWTQYLSICHIHDECVEWDGPAALVHVWQNSCLWTRRTLSIMDHCTY